MITPPVDVNRVVVENRTIHKKQDFQTFMIDFLMGGVSAAVSKTIASPIEVIKLRLQNQDQMIKNGALTERYTGIMDCGSRIVKEEGVQCPLEGQLHQRPEILPHPGAELRLQGLLQENVQQEEGERRIPPLVHRQPRLGRTRRVLLAALRLQSGLRQNQAHQRPQERQEGGRQGVQRSLRRL